MTVVLDVEEHAESESRRQSEWVETQLHSGRGRHLAQRGQKPAPKRPTRRGWALNSLRMEGRGRGAGTWVVGSLELRQLQLIQSRLIQWVCVSLHGALLPGRHFCACQKKRPFAGVEANNNIEHTSGERKKLPECHSSRGTLPSTLG